MSASTTRQRATIAAPKDATHSASEATSTSAAFATNEPDLESSTWVDVALTVFIILLMLAAVSFLTTHTLHFGLLGSSVSISSLTSAGSRSSASAPAPVSSSSSAQPSAQTQTQGPPELSSGISITTTPTDEATPAAPATGADGKPRKRFRKKKPRGSRTFTLSELAAFDGSDPDKPIYIAIKGHVYDVSAGKQYYGKGKGYNIFAGRDCSRAFLTGCFKERYPGHDLRGLTQDQMKEVDNWVKFYQDHETYFYVGELTLPEVTEHTPLPNPDCSVYDDPPITPIPQDQIPTTPAPAPTQTPNTAQSNPDVSTRTVEPDTNSPTAAPPAAAAA